MIGGEPQPEFSEDEVQKIPEIKLEVKEKEYNFEMIKEIEPETTFLVRQLKDAIEKGEYSTLLSDEVGGRIPTLVLNRICKEKGPKENPDKRLKTYFLASGQEYFPKKEKDKDKENYERLVDYLKTLEFGDKKTLIITQIIGRGHTLQRIGVALRDAGIDNFDFASLSNEGLKKQDELEKVFKEMFDAKIFIGGEGYSAPFYEKHEPLSGVIKKAQYSPVVERYKDDDSFGLATIYQNVKEPEKIKTKLKGKKLKDLAREDVELMAQKVIEKVWPKEK